MKNTPMTTLIEFINNIGVTKEVSDETKDALNQLAIHITEKALELQKEEKEVIKEAYNQPIEYDEDYYNETFGALPVAPVIMTQEEFDKHIEDAQEVK
jgi:hypothetical protein